MQFLPAKKKEDADWHPQIGSSVVRFIDRINAGKQSWLCAANCRLDDAYRQR